MPEPRVSAVLIARDEAHNLPDCLDALAWADECVVVVDPASRDATLAVARQRADAVVVRRFDDFASQRNAGLDLATGDWVFSVDADERSSPAQAAEIRRAIADANRYHDAYRVPIRSEILGRPFRYSGTQLDRPVRLFRRDRARWAGAVHEVVSGLTSIGELHEPLSHRTLPDMTTFLRKLDRYTTLEAGQLASRGVPARRRDLLVRPAWTFAKLYLGRQGFRDGVEGLLFCTLSGVSVAVRHWKHREILRGGGLT
jgi:glycosyltransferase involved in cell wall biosynthesis